MTASDDTEPAHDHDSAADVGHDVDDGRTTAPMSEFSTSAVGIGFAVLLVGLVIAFVLPVALL